MYELSIKTSFYCISKLSNVFLFHFSDSKMTAILDQKHYIEELNRHLSGTVTDLQAKMDSLEKTNSKLVEEVRCVLRATHSVLAFEPRLQLRDSSVLYPRLPQLMAATDRINSLREEQEQLQQQNESILQSSQKKEEVS